MAGLRSILLASALLCAASASRADDWPQWRGLNRDGVWRETGIIDTFPHEGLKILWRAPAGAGLASPVVAKGRVYIADVGSDPNVKKPNAVERVRCLDEKTGQPLWSHQYVVKYYDWAFDPKSPNGPSGTPLVADGKVYTRGAAGDLYCLNALSGAVIWKRNTTDEFGLAELSGTTPAPVIEDNLLIVLVGGKSDTAAVALDKTNGKEVWRALSDRWTYSSPIVVTAGGKRQLIIWTPEAITSLDPTSGHTWWRHPLTTLYSDATPVVDGDRLLVSGNMLRLEKDKPGMSPLWTQKLNDTSVPLIQDDCVYGMKTNSKVACFERSTGKQLWETDTLTARRSGACIHFTPNGSSVLIFTDQGNLIRARLTSKGCEELSRVHVIDPTYTFGGRELLWSQPAYADGCVFVRSDKEILCASLQTKE